MVAALDQAGESCLGLLSHITDRMGLQIAVLTAVFALLVSLTLYRIPRYPKAALGPVSMAFALWVQYVIERMPMVHERMHLALATTAGIIQASEDYLASFVSRSGIGAAAAGDSGNIASFLYYLTSAERDAWKCSPQDLYTHLFRTMDQIRGMGIFPGIFPDVHESLWGTWGLVLPVLLVLVAVLAATEQQNGTWQKGRLLWFPPRYSSSAMRHTSPWGCSCAWHSCGSWRPCSLPSGRMRRKNGIRFRFLKNEKIKIDVRQIKEKWQNCKKLIS